MDKKPKNQTSVREALKKAQILPVSACKWGLQVSWTFSFDKYQTTRVGGQVVQGVDRPRKSEKITLFKNTF